jgi:hypothetical protein
MYYICIVMVVFGWTDCDTENNIPSLNLPWSEPVPDHTTIARFGRIPSDWLERVLVRTAHCALFNPAGRRESRDLTVQLLQLIYTDMRFDRSKKA